MQLRLPHGSGHTVPWNRLAMRIRVDQWIDSCRRCRYAVTLPLFFQCEMIALLMIAHVRSVVLLLAYEEGKLAGGWHVFRGCRCGALWNIVGGWHLCH